MPSDRQRGHGTGPAGAPAAGRPTTGRRHTDVPGYAERQAKLRFRDWRFRVRDILGALGAIADYTRDMDLDSFVADTRTRDAVIRNLITMGESVRWIPDAILDAHPGVPWRAMRSVRNVVVHEYFGIDDAILWHTMRSDLPPLVEPLEEVLRS